MKVLLNSYEKRKEGQNDGTVYCNRDEPRRLQFQSGKGGIKGRRRHLLFGKLTDESMGVEGTVPRRPSSRQWKRRGMGPLKKGVRARQRKLAVLRGRSRWECGKSC